MTQLCAWRATFSSILLNDARSRRLALTQGARHAPRMAHQRPDGVVGCSGAIEFISRLAATLPPLSIVRSRRER